MLVGYLVSTDPDVRPQRGRATRSLRQLPAALVPRLVRVDELPTRTSGKVDRNALPWPLPGGGEPTTTPPIWAARPSWLAGLWRDLLGAAVDGPRRRLLRARRRFAVGRAARVAALRERYPQVTVADLYDHPRLGSLAEFLDELDAAATVAERDGPADAVR